MAAGPPLFSVGQLWEEQLWMQGQACEGLSAGCRKAQCAFLWRGTLRWGSLSSPAVPARTPPRAAECASDLPLPPLGPWGGRCPPGSEQGGRAPASRGSRAEHLLLARVRGSHSPAGTQRIVLPTQPPCTGPVFGNLRLRKAKGHIFPHVYSQELYVEPDEGCGERRRRSQSACRNDSLTQRPAQAAEHNAAPELPEARACDRLGVFLLAVAVCSALQLRASSEGKAKPEQRGAMGCWRRRHSGRSAPCDASCPKQGPARGTKGQEKPCCRGCLQQHLHPALSQLFPQAFQLKTGAGVLGSGVCLVTMQLI